MLQRPKILHTRIHIYQVQVTYALGCGNPYYGISIKRRQRLRSLLRSAERLGRSVLSGHRRVPSHRVVDGGHGPRPRYTVTTFTYARKRRHSRLIIIKIDRLIKILLIINYYKNNLTAFTPSHWTVPSKRFPAKPTFFLPIPHLRV